MRLMLLCLSLFGIASVSQAQSRPAAPEHWRHDRELARALAGIVRDLRIDSVFDVGEDGTETISLAVVDLKADAPRWAGVNADNFIYPASVYKMYAAMGALAAIWTNDVGIVQDDRVHCVIACFLPIPEERALPILRELSQRVYAFMAQRD